MLQIANWATGNPGTFDVTQVTMLPTVYLVGLIPARLAAWFGHALATANVSYLIALTALFGYVIIYLPIIGLFWMGFAHGASMLYGLVGALPAALCSWLATARQQPVQA
jgi:uncharacterized membrane protein